MPDHRMPGDTTRKGYGAEHQALRRRWRPLVDAGAVVCPRCHQPIRPGQPWDLGHVDGSGRRLYSGPEHRRCNRSAGAQARAARDPAPRPRTRW